ncbi:hypothetical protein KTR9_0282 [Gordonia sp. KTR9]|nr:hypothetical protein KTR9_0282 [Gordonia sp. KTR9]
MGVDNTIGADSNATADGHESADRAIPRAGPWRSALIGALVGLAFGSVGLAIYGLLLLASYDVIDADITDATVFIGSIAAALTVLCAVVVGIGLRTWQGRGTDGGIVGTLAVLAVLGLLFVYSLPVRSTVDSLLTGSSAQPAVMLTFVGSVAMAMALLAVSALGSKPFVRRNHRAKSGAAGGGVAVIALAVVGAVIAGLYAPPSSLAAAPVPVPDAPTTLGTGVAYRTDVESADDVVPGGAGFVVRRDDEIVGYDGTDGSIRWRVTRESLPAGCGTSFLTIESSGIGPVSKILTNCLQLEEARHHMVMIDAMTGQVLWMRAGHWRVVERSLDSPGIVVVRTDFDDRTDSFAALDAGTGELLWERSPGCPLYYVSVTSTRSGIVVDNCTAPSNSAPTTPLRVYDARTGEERVIELPARVGSPPGRKVKARVLATYSDRLLVQTIADPPSGPLITQLLLIDVTESSVQTVPGRAQAGLADLGRRRAGELVEVDQEYSPARIHIVDLGTAESRWLTGFDGVLHPDGGGIPANAWARVGSMMVTAASRPFSALAFHVATFDRDGRVMEWPSPCGADSSGNVLVVPGAVLLACQRGVSGGLPSHFELLGMR